MKIKKQIIIPTIAAATLIIIAVICYVIGVFDQEETANIKQKIHLLKANSTIMRLKIVQPQSETGRDEEGLYLAAKFYNLDENMVGRLETPINADSILFTFQKIVVDNKSIFFPENMYFIKNGKNNKNINLKNYYTLNNKTPGIYTSKIIDQQLKQQIETIYTLLNDKKFETIDKKYGVYSQCSATLKKPKQREVYSITINTNGLISIK